MRITAVTALPAVAVAAVLLAACSSAVEGSGAGSETVSAPSASDSSAHSASASASALPSTPGASTGSASTGSVSTGSASKGSASTAASSAGVATPKACAAGSCQKIASADVGDGYTATVYSGPSPSGLPAADYLELSSGGRAVFWRVTDGYSPGQLVCSPRPVPNCAVEDAFGAHASVARGYVRRGDRLVQFDDIQTDTPITDVLDLDGDGWVDVRSVQNDYQPSYATGHVYWTTALSNGRLFAVSGCSAKLRRLGPKPTAPLRGSCAD